MDNSANITADVTGISNADLSVDKIVIIKENKIR